MKRGITRIKALEVEKLEQRTLLTGNVDAFVNADGDFVAWGDDADNTILISQQNDGEEGVVSIWGDDGTTINGQMHDGANPLVISGLTRDISVNLNRGNDVFLSYGVNTPRDLRVMERAGDDEIHVYLGSVGRMMDISAGDGEDEAHLDGVKVNQALLLDSGAGNDHIHIARSKAALMTIDAGAENDRVFVRDVNVDIEERINGGSGERDFLLMDDIIFRAGDANFDGQFDQRDIVLALQGGKYLTGEPATFAEGDWNSDGVFDQLDIVAALETGDYLQGAYLPVSEFEELGQVVSPDTLMDLKLDDGKFILIRPAFGPEAHMQGVDDIMGGLLTSGAIPLPTAPDPTGEDEIDFSDHLARFDDAINTLTRHIQLGANPANNMPDESTAHAADARNFLRALREALENIALETAQCDPQNPSQPIGAGCGFLLADDEGGNTLDNILGGNPLSRQVRSPFPLIFASASLTPSEQIIPTGPLANGECAGIVKEIQGIKGVVTPRIMPIWIEPWFARRNIVGFKTVWVFEFVPAEFIKTISVCNIGGTLVTDADSLVVHDRALMTFWRFLDKDVTTVKH